MWTDKLTAYGDTEIETDSIGNPLNLTGVNFLGQSVNSTLEWNGRQLASATVDGTRYEYTYDSEGMRTSMAVYDVETNALMTSCYYVWENGKLRGYTVTDGNGVTENTVKMLFDINDDSVGYELYSADDNTTKTFFFLKNLQGDITNVYNENGEDVLQYAYDAWGNVTVLLDKSSFEDINKSIEAAVYTPITYRGYCYDFYTGLYYLQSRYYNPLYGRFLNMDDTSILEKTSGTVHGANLFAYCNNDPVMNVDYTGMYIATATIGTGVSAMSIIGSLILVGALVILLLWVINPDLFKVEGIEFSLGEVISKWKILCTVMAFTLVNVTIPSLIKDIDARLTKYKYRNGQQEHHIAPQKVVFNKGKEDEVFCSYYLKKADIDINSPINKVWLNASFHSALNTNVYYSAVYQFTKSFFDVMNKIGVYLALIILRVFLLIFNYLYMIGNGGVV